MINKLLSCIIKLYQYIISPMIGPKCRFYPTCSNYALIALKKHNIVKALYLIIKRIVKCNPFSGKGIDQVPD